VVNSLVSLILEQDPEFAAESHHSRAIIHELETAQRILNELREESSTSLENTGSPQQGQAPAVQGHRDELLDDIAMTNAADVLESSDTPEAEEAVEKHLLSCTICGDEFPYSRIITLKCECTYCGPCLKKLFLRATKDETEHPPNCCGERIPMARLDERKLLTYKERKAYQIAKIEFNTEDRLYCANPQCSKFILPERVKDSINGFIKCNYCRKNTCRLCKSSHDPTLGCPPKDQATLALETLSQSKGWRQCGRCRAMVELDHGCFHMM
jgi:hypothetical protein